MTLTPLLLRMNTVIGVYFMFSFQYQISVFGHCVRVYVRACVMCVFVCVLCACVCVCARARALSRMSLRDIYCLTPALKLKNENDRECSGIN
jgi:hypothetical protein